MIDSFLTYCDIFTKYFLILSDPSTLRSGSLRVDPFFISAPRGKNKKRIKFLFLLIKMKKVLDHDIDSVFKKSPRPHEAFLDWEKFQECYKSDVKKSFNSNKSNNIKLLQIFGTSHFLSAWLIKNPAEADTFFSSPYLSKPKDASVIKKEIKNLLQKSPSSLEALCTYKYREYLRLTLKDLNGTSQEEILSELSALCYLLLQTINHLTYEESVAKWGKPTNEYGHECAYHALAMGKLGGMEINYSSDVDLIAFIENEFDYGGKYSTKEFFSRHFQNLTHTLQTRTENGFFYRVDWDLRPQGRDGALIQTKLSMETYYETVGANWERQAYIKAAPCLGDQKLGEDFLETMTAFVYRKHLDWVSIQEVQSIKQKINTATKSTGKIYNVKLGLGGIREIEFFIQAFLLIYGGRIPSLRHRNSLKALASLVESKLLGNEDAKHLRESYLFLRKLEHRLQMVDEAQTHDLHLSPQSLGEAARSMGYMHDSLEEASFHFQQDLQKATQRNHEIYNRLFADDAPTTVPARFTKRPIDIPLYHYRDSMNELSFAPKNLEENLDALRIFKKNHIAEIIKLERFKGISRKTMAFKLSLLAEAIAQKGLELSFELLKPIYGVPQYLQNNVSPKPSELVAMGMGKFGGFELGYGSDLDLIFIYSEEGETTGPKIISNQEFFARLAQKFIFVLSVTTRQGFAYKVDTELRPSGKQGLLVTSFHQFMEYQKNASQIWERQALLRAHPMIGPAAFNRFVMENIKVLLFNQKYPESIKDEMNRLRMRVEKELAHESKNEIDFKLGCGGIMDIEFLLQYLQLICGHEYAALRTQNTFEGLDRLLELNLLKNQTEALLLKEAYTFYRSFEAKVFLKKELSVHRLKINDPDMEEIALNMGFKNAHDCWQALQLYRDQVRSTYNKILT
ncbi:MAG TPA: hypothetical protein DDW49_08310 [Deltaproteobacteria bacterium]|nr:hypothetical protein [Deltaproteobacteria bacterium]